MTLRVTLLEEDTSKLVTEKESISIEKELIALEMSC